MKNKKAWKPAAILLLIGALIAGCSVSAAGTSTGAFVINENVKLDSSIADSNLQVNRGEDLHPTVDVLFKDVLGIYQGALYYNLTDGFYALDLATNQRMKLLDHPVSRLSKEGPKAFFTKDDEAYVYDLQEKKSYKATMGAAPYAAFADVSGNYLTAFNQKTNMLELQYVKTGEIQQWALADMVAVENLELSDAMLHKDKIYLPVHTKKDGLILYQLSRGGQKAEVLLDFPGDSDNLTDFHFLKDGTLLFNGSYNNKSGIFHYNPVTKAAKQLVSGGTDKEGSWVPFYSLSPDESKIMFDMQFTKGDKNKTNVYMAELQEGRLTNSLKLMEEVELPAVISLLAHWSLDSKAVYITLPQQAGEYDKIKLGEIATYKF